MHFKWWSHSARLLQVDPSGALLSMSKSARPTTTSRIHLRVDKIGQAGGPLETLRRLALLMSMADACAASVAHETRRMLLAKAGRDVETTPVSYASLELSEGLAPAVRSLLHFT